MHQLQAVDTTVQDQVATIQAWLEDHQQLLYLLDAAMRREFDAIEARIKQNAFLQNVLFCIAGAILGILFPWLLGELHL